ncbi:MAG TPA: TrmH family RNA methyltransferase [Patescibacteria group bacterium]|nr:TrmH family RNA methyltransferase [Patescibacteria group bacterium]
MRKFTLVVLAHNIRSTYNVGSVFRTANAFGVNQVLLSGYTPRPDTQPKVGKTALGAEHSVPWRGFKRFSDAIKYVKREVPGISIVALENNLPDKSVMSLKKYVQKGPILLVLGEEVAGLNRKYYKYIDQFVEIPMQGKKESLNVATACGIALFHLRK